MEKNKKVQKNENRSLLSLLFFLTFSLSMWGGPLEIFTSSKGINAAQSAVMITDLKTGEVVLAHNIDKALVPASIMKSVTIAGLLSHTGPERKYYTDVLISGPEVNGVLAGDIIVKGCGDPSLNSRHVNGTDIIKEIVKELKERGIKRIKGKIRIDESVWSGPAICPSWGTGDLPHAYGTGQHGLNFEDNASGSKSVSNPAGVFQSRLRSAMTAAGISMDNEELQESKQKVLLTHQSVPIDEIMRSCMMRSDNQYAEAMLRTLAVVEGEPGSREAGAKINTDIWTRSHAPMEGVFIEDGSGLSRKNNVTAAFMTHVLKTMWRDPYYVSFFPLAGQEGTLRKFLSGTPLEGYLAMKTGSMSGIQCYAGYKLNDDYEPTHTVVVIMNQLVSRDAAKKSVGDMLLNLFEQ